ncbi:MAG: hypothetical protein WBV39_14005 [Rudaea sp.]
MPRTIRFAVLGLLVLASADLFAATPFHGTFSANGKSSKLNHLVALKGKPFDNKPVIQLVFSEKDASHDPDAPMDAQFGNLGDALSIRVSGSGTDWNVIGCEPWHSALKHSGSSNSGLVWVNDVKINGGFISGHLYTRPGATVFDEPVQIDLRFHVKQP